MVRTSWKAAYDRVVQRTRLAEDEVTRLRDGIVFALRAAKEKHPERILPMLEMELRHSRTRYEGVVEDDMV